MEVWIDAMGQSTDAPPEVEIACLSDRFLVTSGLTLGLGKSLVFGDRYIHVEGDNLCMCEKGVSLSLQSRDSVANADHRFPGIIIRRD